MPGDGTAPRLHGRHRGPVGLDAEGVETGRRDPQHDTVSVVGVAPERVEQLYPAQTGGDNSMSCWNWFRPGDQMRDTGEPAIIAGLTESLRDQYAVPKDRVFVAGLSAGGAMAAIMGETYPELYGAIGVHSGLAYGSANDVMSAFTAMRGQVGIEQAPSRNGGGGPEFGP